MYDRVLSQAAPSPSRYDVLRRLAVGGMGEIFLARQEIAGVRRLVVLKRLLPDVAEDPVRLAMFVDEARIAANLAHPGIVQVHEFGQDELGYFIVMEYVAGHDLGRVLTRAHRDDQPIAMHVAAYICFEVARALDHAHNARDSEGRRLDIVHRDISPSNVLVSFQGEIKLLDFGVARSANRVHRTTDGAIRGKVAYMAPEQLEGADVDAKTDVYAVGVVLWETTLRRRLFEGRNEVETIRAALEAPIPRPSSIDPYYPPALEAIVMAALERDRAKRLATAAELAAQLKAFLRDQPADRDDVAALMATLFPDDAAESLREVEATTKPRVAGRDAVATRPLGPPPPPTELVVAPRRSRAWPVLLVLVLLAGGGVGGWYVATHRASGGEQQDAPRVASVRDDAPAVEVVPDAAPDADSAPVGSANLSSGATRGSGASHHGGTKHGGSGNGRGSGVTRGSDDGSASVQAGSAQPAATPITVTIGVGNGPRENVHVDRHAGFDCRDATSLPMTCTTTPGMHELHIRVTGGVEFDATFDVPASATHCIVDLLGKHVRCS